MGRMQLSELTSWLKTTIASPSVNTLGSHQVAPIFREPFIHTGYRLPNQPWAYYWKSFFQLHNETANVWLHLLATFIVLKNIWEFSYTFDLLHDKYGWSLIGFSLGCLFGALFSSIAHHFHSRSIWWHYVLFMMDYGGVSLYTFGTGLGCIYICSQKDVYGIIGPFFLPLNVFLTLFTFYMCCRAKLKSSTQRGRRHAIVAVMLFHAAVISVPVFARYAECMTLPRCSLASLNHLTWCFALLALSAVLFASHVPERFFPGRFDLGGHGHSLFHLVSLFTMGKQMEGVMVDISRGAAAHTRPNLQNILTAYAFLIAAQMFTLFSLRGDINTRVKKDTLHWQSLLAKRN